MKKLHLNIDALRVESFTAQPQPRGAGTVHAQQYDTDGGSCYSDRCFPTDFCMGNDDTWVISCHAAHCEQAD